MLYWSGHRCRWAGADLAACFAIAGQCKACAAEASSGALCDSACRCDPRRVGPCYSRRTRRSRFREQRGQEEEEQSTSSLLIGAGGTHTAAECPQLTSSAWRLHTCHLHVQAASFRLHRSRGEQVGQKSLRRDEGAPPPPLRGARDGVWVVARPPSTLPRPVRPSRAPIRHEAVPIHSSRGRGQNDCLPRYLKLAHTMRHPPSEAIRVSFHHHRTDYWPLTPRSAILHGPDV